MYFYTIIKNTIRTTMKKYIFIALVFIGTAAYAQTSIEPQFEVEANEISATYFHDNGAIQQQGTFDKKGKLIWFVTTSTKTIGLTLNDSLVINTKTKVKLFFKDIA